MNRLLLPLALLPFLAATIPAAAQTSPSQAEKLRDAALEDDIALDIVRDLTTEVGPRLAGTEAEARARTWAVARLKSLGFKNVHIEEYRMRTWVRGAESAEIVGPYAQKLAITALGHSGATPAEGITAQVVGFDNLEAFRAAPDASVRGRIVFISHAMKAAQDGSGYGYYGPVRREGPRLGAQKGAVAVVIRSLGTDYHRNPHTGLTSWQNVTPIPAGALSIPDAENLERMLELDKPVTMRLVLTPRFIGEQVSGNVVAEVPGTDPRAGILLIGGHLDSWDLGTGAIDDAAGVAITAAAAKRIMDSGRPRRTIRVVWFGSEEVGGFGSTAYRAAHKDENVVFVAESDFGSDRVWRMDSSFPAEGKPLVDRVAALLFPLGITRGTARAGAGADLGDWATAGVAAIDLQQDGTRYFDLHHTPDDTFDKVDPAQLRQNVAAWTAMLAVLANAREEIGKAPPRP